MIVLQPTRIDSTTTHPLKPHEAQLLVNKLYAAKIKLARTRKQPCERDRDLVYDRSLLYYMQPFAMDAEPDVGPTRLA